MNAQDIVGRMLEAGQVPADPDDPATFVRNYRSAWERAGFQPVVADESGNERYVWKEGIFSVEVTHEPGGDPNGPRQFGNEGGWEIYAFISNVKDDPEDKSQSAYARKTAKSEAKALVAATRLRHEISTSMAARLNKLGFVGWRNHWHKAPITVTLKPSKHGGYANIELRMDYVPNDAAIKAVTALNKVADKILPT